jgi:hypothetical protein
MVCSLNQSDPFYIVCKLLMSNLYQRKQKNYGLDARGMFIIQTESSLWLWIGSELPAFNHEHYMKAVDKHVALLEKFERASKDLRVVEQGKETDEFWSMLGFNERP